MIACGQRSASRTLPLVFFDQFLPSQPETASLGIAGIRIKYIKNLPYQDSFYQVLLY